MGWKNVCKSSYLVSKEITMKHTKSHLNLQKNDEKTQKQHALSAILMWFDVRSLPEMREERKKDDVKKREETL